MKNAMLEGELSQNPQFLQVLEALDEKEKKLIEMRYFQDKTQSEVAACMGISQVQVSRLEKKILFKMRGFLNFL